MDPTTVAELIGEFPEWQRSGDTITATYAMPTFPLAIELVNRVAVAAEAANHHPDIDIRWRRVAFVLTTHEAGGLTNLDVELARDIHAKAVQLGWAPS